MFSEEQVVDFIRGHCQVALPSKCHAENLHDIFMSMSKSDIQELFSHIDCGESIFPRVTKALSPSCAPIEPVPVLSRLIAKYSTLVPAIGDKELVDRWPSVDIDPGLRSDDGDLHVYLVDVVGDWIAAGEDESHPIGILREAFYSLVLHPLVALHFSWPCNKLASQYHEPLSEYFDLWVGGYRVISSGNVVNAVKR